MKTLKKAFLTDFVALVLTSSVLIGFWFAYTGWNTAHNQGLISTRQNSELLSRLFKEKVDALKFEAISHISTRGQKISKSEYILYLNQNNNHSSNNEKEKVLLHNLKKLNDNGLTLINGRVYFTYRSFWFEEAEEKEAIFVKEIGNEFLEDLKKNVEVDLYLHRAMAILATTITDEEGKFISPTASPSIPKKKESSKILVDLGKIKFKDEFVFIYNQEELQINQQEVDAYIGQIPLKGIKGTSRVQLTVVVPKQAVMRKFYRSFVIFVFISIIVIFISTLLADKIAYRIATPISEFTENVKDIAKSLTYTENESNETEQGQASNNKNETVELISLRNSIEVLKQEIKRSEVYKENLIKTQASLDEKTKILIENEKKLVKAKEQAIQAAEVKANFMSNMSHELRTPMNGIIGLSEILMNDANTEEQRKHASLLLQSSTSLLHILNDILDFSKLEEGRMLIEEIPFDMSEIVDELEKTLDFTKNKNENTLKFEFNSRSKYFKGDPHRIKQVLLNLITNAYKFTQNGNINISIHYDDKSERLQAKVTDNGIGIEKDALEKLFTPFTQASSSTNRRYGGTGLGLSISKNLVELMGGEISAVSKVKVGSTFSFEIPLKLSTVKELELLTEAEKAHIDHYDLHILIAEDNKVNQVVIKNQLEKLGCTFEVADNGKEAIEHAQTKVYDLILMDCQMPEIDGFEATEKIRKIEAPKKSNIHIVAITANVLPEEKKKCFDAGMDDFLSKPIKRNDLSQILASIVKKKKSNITA